MKNSSLNELKGYLIEFPNYLSIFLFSIYFLLASPILLDISADTGLDPGNLSLVFTLYTIGGISGQLTSVFYSRRFNRFSIVVSAFLILIPVTVLLFFAHTLLMFYILYFLAGYILGLVWIQANANIFESKVKNKDRITTIALTFYPVGAFFAPMIASSIVKSSLDWRYIYGVIIGVTVITISLYIIITRKIQYVEEKDKKKFPLTEIFGNKRNNILLVIVSFTIITYCIAEMVMSTWSPTFYRLSRSFDVGEAGYVVSLFWLSIIIGRVIVGAIAGKVRNIVIMITLAALAIISVSFSIFINSNTLIFIGIFFSGLGFSGLFPLLISSGNKVFEKGKDLIATVLFAAANIGISIAPFLTRAISENNLFMSVFISAIFMAATLIFIIVQHLVKKSGYKNQL
ncbi:MAG: MFS transporter [Actinomycetota bacterium]